MIMNRRSMETKPNEELEQTSFQIEETNTEWITRVGATNGILLLGGSSLVHFRIRVAQSHLRTDLLPSFWSQAGVLLNNGKIATVPMDYIKNSSQIPSVNGIQICDISDYDDPYWFPNIAILQFSSSPESIEKNIAKSQMQRLEMNLPSAIVSWLGFVWGISNHKNPLLEGMGMPCSMFVEAIHQMSLIDLTPGLSSIGSCPEAIWQSGKWWRTFYESLSGQPKGSKDKVLKPSASSKKKDSTVEAGNSHTSSIPPQGYYLLRQEAAAARENKG